MSNAKKVKAQLKAPKKERETLEEALAKALSERDAIAEALLKKDAAYQKKLAAKDAAFHKTLAARDAAFQKALAARDAVLAQTETELRRLRGGRLGLIEKAKPTTSASQIFSNPLEYDEFSATVDLIATFIPNERLRAILDCQPDQNQVNAFADFLRTKYKFALSLVHIQGGSETNLVDVNLQSVVRKLLEYFDAEHVELVHVQKMPQPDTYLAKNVQGEHSIYDVSTNVVVIGCEAKGIRASHRQCIAQLLALCGNGAMGLYKRGVALNNCVSLGIAFADTGIQFCGVYLLDKSFPVFLNLSTVLHPLHHAEEIAKWMLRLVHGATLSLDDLHASTEIRKNVKLELNADSYFIKPIREGYKGATFRDEPYQTRSILPSRLDHILRIYDRLHDHYTRLQAYPTNSWAILFPEGCITVPSRESSFQEGLIAAIHHEEHFRSLDLKLRPCLLFPRLQMAKKPSDSLTLWRDFKPPAHLVEPYMTAFRRAVSFLNEAGVIHFDLRPINVLWRSTNDGNVELMLIDFDDALFSNQRIPHAFAKAMRIDCRFPLYGKIRDHWACAEHNNFYVAHQELWLSQDEYATFDDFMNSRTKNPKAKRAAEEESSTRRHRSKHNDDNVDNDDN